MRIFVSVLLLAAVVFAGSGNGTPHTFGDLWVTHDTGNIKLSVSCVGGIGHLYPSGPGLGLHFPPAGPDQLFHGSLLLANSETYVVDRFFGEGATPGHDTDFVIIDSLERGTTHGQQEWGCLMDDANHPNSTGLKVDQYTVATARTGYEDFVIFLNEISNPTDDSVTGLYFGTWLDLDINPNPSSNVAGTDTVRRCVYEHMSGNEYPTVGIKLLDPPGWANLCCVNHALWVYPDTEVSERTKWRLLSGDIRVLESDTAFDWSAVASWGPFDLAPGESQRVDFAILGGSTVEDFMANCDSAQAFHTHLMGIEEGPGNTRPARFSVRPNPFRTTLAICLAPGIGPTVAVRVYDATGNLVRTLHDGATPGHELNWDARDSRGQFVQNGIYFVKVATPSAATTAKLILAR
jgi:hypothetical protein